MTCPHCGAPMQFPPDQVGARGPCYRCGRDVVVTAPVQAAGFVGSGGMTLEQGLAIHQAARKLFDFGAAGSVTAKMNQASELLLSRQYAQAADAFRTIAEQHPEERGDCYGQVGAAIYFLGRYEEAIAWYEAALAAGADPSMMQDNIAEAREALAKRS